jgi:phytoene dehydrogenase-like protein
MTNQSAPQLKSIYDAVIVGSGHNGLVAAAYLAKAGRSVLVLEQNDYIGGATASQQLFPDYDAWISRYAYLISLLPRQIVDELGLQFATRRRQIASFTPYTDSKGNSGGLVISNIDEQRSRDSMFELAGNHQEWAGFQRLQELEKSIAEVVWPSLLEPLKSRADFRRSLQTEQQREAWESFVERPLGEIVERVVQNDLVRGLVFTDAKIGVFTHPLDPSLIQNRCFLYHVIGNGTGEWQVPVGGMRSLVDALVAKCQSAGVEFLTQATAQHVELGDSLRTVTLQQQGREFSVGARDVLINAGPRTFAKLMGTKWQPIATDEGSVVKVNMLLRRLSNLKVTGLSREEAFCGSFHIDEGYGQMRQSFARAESRQIPDPIPCEMYCHTLTDPSILSPELQRTGYHTLTLFALDMPYRLFADDHDERRDQVKRLLLDGLERVCAESFVDCLARDASGNLCLEIKTPQDLEREVGLDLGNIFHNSLSWFFTDEPDAVGTWGVETEFSRVFRAGSSALRGGAVSGIPGRNAAMCILSKE